jgi:hypothetical protein
MEASQRDHLERRHGLQGAPRRRRGAGEPRPITDFGFDGSELIGWTLYRARHDERTLPPSWRTLWDRGNPAAELLSIDVWKCASAAAAYDQLLEILGNVQCSPAATGIGDLAFSLGYSMLLFQRVNVVVFIRNAGPQIVEAEPVARALDQLLVQRSRP